MFPNLDTSHVQGCFRVKYRHNSGTAFLRTNSERSFFVSASHCLKGAIAGDNLEIYRDQGWVLQPIKDIVHHEEGHDICVFSLDTFKVKTRLIEPKSTAMRLGSPAIFIGFPHGLAGNYPSQAGFPTPVGQNHKLLTGDNAAAELWVNECLETFSLYG